jgi:hypothetical protein
MWSMDHSSSDTDLRNALVTCYEPSAIRSLVFG